MQTRSRMILVLGAVAAPLAIAASASGRGPENLAAASQAPGEPTPAMAACEPGSPSAQPGEPAESPGRLGVARLVADALSSLCVSPADQPAVDQALDTITTRSAAVQEAKQDLLLGLADALEAGSLDGCAIDEKVSAWAAVASGAASGIASDLAEIHAVLDADQRQELADALASGIEQQKAEAASGGWIDQLGKDLDLSEDQRARIREAVAGFAPEIEAESKAHTKAIDALRGEDFSPGQAFPSETVADHTRARAARMVAFTEALIRILTPEQRARAAGALREKLQA